MYMRVRTLHLSLLLRLCDFIFLFLRQRDISYFYFIIYYQTQAFFNLVLSSPYIYNTQYDKHYYYIISLKFSHEDMKQKM
jgi:hypothetical protein